MGGGQEGMKKAKGQGGGLGGATWMDDWFPLELAWWPMATLSTTSLVPINYQLECTHWSSESSSVLSLTHPMGAHTL